MNLKKSTNSFCSWRFVSVVESAFSYQTVLNASTLNLGLVIRSDKNRTSLRSQRFKLKADDRSHNTNLWKDVIRSHNQFQRSKRDEIANPLKSVVYHMLRFSNKVFAFDCPFRLETFHCSKRILKYRAFFRFFSILEAVWRTGISGRVNLWHMIVIP